MTGVLIAAGTLLAAWSTLRPVGFLPGILIGVALIVAGIDRHLRRHQRAADRRRRARGGHIL